MPPSYKLPVSIYNISMFRLQVEQVSIEDSGDGPLTLNNIAFLRDIAARCHCYEYG